MIPISIPKLHKEEKKLAIDAIKNGYIGHGKYIEEFENKFATYLNVREVVALANGTEAVYLALKS